VNAPAESTTESLRATVSKAERLQRSRLGPLVRGIVSRLRTPIWILRGSPAPAPPHRKGRVVATYARRIGADTFVETGTYRGDTLALVAPIVKRAMSIELDPTLADFARLRFASSPNVAIITGDSADALVAVVAGLVGPALFWLDGHYSGGATADSGESPIMAEIETVLASEFEHTILIDDVRLFDGSNGYPTIAALRARVESLRVGWQFTVQNDIARVNSPSQRDL
jgi:hypothetical protein